MARCQVGMMVQYLTGLATDKIFSANFDFFCQGLFKAFALGGAGSLCGQGFPVFGKQSTKEHPIFLGRATVQCYGQTDVGALIKMCTAPCMANAGSGCCWVPFLLSGYFPCCRSLGCCRDQARPPTRAPTPAASTPCADQHSNCPTLKKQLQSSGASCSSDLGKLLSNASLAGKQLRDECCASCATAAAANTTGGGAAPATASCEGALVTPCSKCVATLTKDMRTLSGKTMGEARAVALCQSYGLACSSLFCAKCLASGISRQQCASFGLSCACNATSGSPSPSPSPTDTAPKASRRALTSLPRRALQGAGVSVAVNVDRGASSRARFDTLSKCLQKAKSQAATMTCLAQT